MKNVFFRGTLVCEKLPDHLAMELAEKLGADARLENCELNELDSSTEESKVNLRDFLLSVIESNKKCEHEITYYHSLYRYSEPEKYYAKSDELRKNLYYAISEKTIEFLDKFVTYTTKLIQHGKLINLAYAHFYWALLDRLCDFINDDLITYVENNAGDENNQFVGYISSLLQDSDTHLIEEYAKCMLKGSEYTDFCKVVNFVFEDETKDNDIMECAFMLEEKGVFVVKNTTLGGLGLFFENSMIVNRCIPYEPLDELIKSAKNVYSYTTGVCLKRNAYVDHILSNNADVVVDGVSLTSVLSKMYEVNPLVQLQGDYTGGVALHVDNKNKLSLLHLDNIYFEIEDTECVKDYRTSAIAYIMNNYDYVGSEEKMIAVLDEAKHYLRLSNEVDLCD